MQLLRCVNHGSQVYLLPLRRSFLRHGVLLMTHTQLWIVSPHLWAYTVVPKGASATKEIRKDLFRVTIVGVNWGSIPKSGCVCRWLLCLFHTGFFLDDNNNINKNKFRTRIIILLRPALTYSDTYYWTTSLLLRYKGYAPHFIIPVDVVPWLSAGCPVMGILIGKSWPRQDYLTTVLFQESRTHYWLWS